MALTVENGMVSKDGSVYTVKLRKGVKFHNGNAFTARGVADGEYRVYDRAGNFLSLSRAEGGELRATKNFF